MRKYKKYWFYLLLALSISLTILVINNINDQLIPTIIQDINSGVIGAILTTIITLILLSNQTESQENLTKSSVVYEEKLKIFNAFLETIGNCLEDGKLTAQETTKIIHSFSILRIHISTENALTIEKAISNIDNSFFFYDENNIPNLTRLIDLYTELTSVFRQELYGNSSKENLKNFNFNNLKNVLFNKRTSTFRPINFSGLLTELKSNPKILHTSNKTGITIVYEITEELIASLSYLNEFMESALKEIPNEIHISYEINRKIINDEIYSGIPWIKLYYKEAYCANFGITENKRLRIGTNIPESKQVLSVELFETDKLEKNKQQIISELKNTFFEIDKKTKIGS